MNRRRFLQTSGIACAAIALTKFPAFAAELADQKKRVGLIGSGWYGKVDLLRLIQVAPVEVVSLCDVDKRMLAEAAEILEKRIRVEGVKTGKVTALDLPAQITQSLQLGIISESEAASLRSFDAKVMDLVNVDDFAPHEIGNQGTAAA